MLYQAQDAWMRLMAPGNFVASSLRQNLSHPWNPANFFPGTRVLQAQLELIERQTANYPRPEWRVFDRQGQLMDEVVRFDKPYCVLVEFVSPGTKAADEMPNILLVAPLSGHWATLLRDTVQTFAQDHRVFVTDWKNTRDVAVSEGEFHLDDYVDYLLDFIRTIDGPVHAVAVCQPSVPVLMTAAVQAMRGEQKQLSSITLMGGPIDTRLSPTKVNQYAAKKRLDWFEKNVVTTVPLGYEGVGQRVYPGFLQLSGFMAMNLNNHLSSHFQFFRDLISGDGDSAEKHRAFYDEYLAVMDLPADYYLETLEAVFIEHHLPQNKMKWRGQTLDMTAIEAPALMTIEGELDDITGHGQTEAAQGLLSGIPRERKAHWEQPGAGHYGIFNGRKFRQTIAPKIKDFIAQFNY